MRVLLGANITEAQGGGVATYVRQTASGVEKLGATVDVFWGKPASRGFPGPAATLRFAYKVAAAATSGGYDVVAAQGAEGALLTGAGPGRVVISHGDEGDAWRARLAYAPIRARERIVTPYAAVPLYRRAIKSADVVIALHEGEAMQFRAERRQGPNTVHVIPNGCGLLHDDAVPLPGRIAFVGNWLPRKGSLVVPAIFRAVRNVMPDVTLNLVGPGSAVLAEFDHDDRGRVRCLGFVEPSETELVLRSTDVLLMPSYFEGMPLAVLEALCFGVPTVGFGIAGTVAAAGKAGVFVAPGDVDGCANALARVIGDRMLRRRLSEEAFRRSQQFTWAATAERTLAAYEHAARQARG
jgi:glycosyltransferase involved in cell wall biosynthesis